MQTDRHGEAKRRYFQIFIANAPKRSKQNFPFALISRNFIFGFQAYASKLTQWASTVRRNAVKPGGTGHSPYVCLLHLDKNNEHT